MLSCWTLETETGVTIDQQTKRASWIMIASLLPYIVAQIPLLLGMNTGDRFFIASAAVTAVIGLFIYCGYQVIETLDEVSEKLDD